MTDLSVRNKVVTEARSSLNLKEASKIWLQIALVHLLPVGITGALGAVYVAGLGWNASADEVSLLLIAAKVYEYLILASLSSFMLHRIRVALRSSCGVPFGFLTTPFRVNASVGPYLISRQFSCGAWSMARDKGRGGDLTTKFLIVAISALAIAAAPSSSILMLPRLGWWPIATPASDYVLTSPVPVLSAAPISPSRVAFEPRPLDGGRILFNATMSQLYPQILNSSTVPSFCNHDKQSKLEEQHGSFMERQSPECPYAGLSEVISGLPQILTLDYIPEYISNLSMSGKDYTRHIYIGWRDSPSDSEKDTCAVTYTTTPPDFVSRQLHIYGGNAFWKQSRSELKTVSVAVDYTLMSKYDSSTFEWVSGLRTNYRRWHQPAVATECAPLVSAMADEDTGAPSEHQYVAYFSVGPHAPLHIAISTHNSIFGSLLEQSAGLRYVSIATIAKEADLFPSGISAAFIYQSADLMSLCLVAAKWVQSDVWLAQPFDNAAQSSVSVDPSLATSETFGNLSDVLTISDDWLGILDTPSAPSNWSTVSSGFTKIGAACKGNTQQGRCLSIAISLYITDALARVQYYRKAYGCEVWLPSLARQTQCQPIWNNEDDNPERITLYMGDMRGFTGLSSTYYRLQHGYGVNSLTVSLAWITVMLHAILVLSHIIVHVIRKKTYQEAGWSDIGELVACVLKAEGASNSICIDPMAKDDKMVWRSRSHVKSHEGHPVQPVIDDRGEAVECG
ncbi:hypothetical protein F5Y10DRAFT_92265 [Nemania abortiva]|nr:hypothetical protein F5Y10DRAFT_92265 [Nemania abortiva]